MKSSMKLSVSFLAGTDIFDAVAEARLKAEVLNVAYVCFNFNGCEMSISKKAVVSEVVKLWENSETIPKYIIR